MQRHQAVGARVALRAQRLHAGGAQTLAIGGIKYLVCALCYFQSGYRSYRTIRELGNHLHLTFLSNPALSSFFCFITLEPRVE